MADSPLRGYSELLDGFEGLAGDDVYVMVCDVDDFRAVNETHGKAVGDEVLVRVGQLIRQCFGQKHAFLYGSDEFIVVNSFFDEDSFLEKIDNLNYRLESIEREGESLGITCSYGYVHGKMGTAADLHEAIRSADHKMYEAKRLGKARAVGALLATDTILESVGAHAGAFKSYETDELTGLANLVYFRSALGDMLANIPESQLEEGNRAALVYFNVENFKGYNQHFGFDAGDELLLLVSHAIQESFPGSLASRFSADQFMVVTGEQEVIPGIKAVRASFRKKHKDSSIWLRAGYYLIARGDDDAGIVCDRAKVACDAIRGRRDSFYNRYDEKLKHQITWRRYVLDNFDRALREGWIRAYYQPIVRVATGEACDVEALARWVDPVEGVVSPADFIPALEDARLIHRLDLQVLRSVCEECKQLQDMGREFIPPSINLSRLDFELCDIVSEVEAVLDEYGIGRDMISVEVTESALTGNQDFLKGEVDRFRADGFEVWMDDFGSGYSSLNVLKDYKFDLVKVDMAFLRGFEDVKESRVMLAHVVNMAKELGFQTLVEGVETQEQLDFLRSIGVGRAQGYLIGKPLPLEDSIALSREGRFPRMEPFAKRRFYEEIGHVNLIRPDPHPPMDGMYLPSDVAASIIRRMDGRYEYLNTNDLYAKFLRDCGIGTTADSEAVINDTSNPRRTRFISVIDACAETGDWEYYTMHVGSRPLLVRMKMISEMPEHNAIAVLSIVDTIPVQWEKGLTAGADAGGPAPSGSSGA